MLRRDKIFNRIFDNCKIVDDCLIWQGGTSGKTGRGCGYGRISIDGYSSAVHRVAWVCINGYLPVKKQLDHTCGNRLCCNPSHLEPVTAKENCKRRSSRSK